jgi:AraC-like DNA-binding protein
MIKTRPQLNKVATKAETSFDVEIVDRPNFITYWHFHQMYEFNMVQESTGTLFVGDNVSKFGPGNLIFLGKNLPHAVINDDIYFEKPGLSRAKNIVFKFSERIFGQSFLEIPELRSIRNFLENSGRGLKFGGETRNILQKEIEDLSRLEGFKKIHKLLNILHICSVSDEYTFLASEGYTNIPEYTDCERIEKVYDYVMKNFSKNIKLDDVADIANLSPPSFCRYFKSRSQRTFTRYVNEIRIGYACKLLIEKNYTPSEACYESGFNFPSNFYKQFHSIKGMSPMEYKSQYLKGMKEDRLAV